jgi:predicted amidohydrolase YtcJ
MAHDLTLIVKGNVITMVNSRPRAEAIGVKDGKIVSVGPASEVEKGAGKSTQLLDLKDKTILPGFIDSHTHPIQTGMARLGVELSSVKSVAETLEKITQRAKITPPDKLIFCPGYNRFMVEEKRFPSKEELDAISTRHPIVVQHFDAHFCMLNSPALKLLGFSADMEGVVTDSSRELTGLVEDPASGHIIEEIESSSNDDEIMEIMMAVAREALEAGITTIHAKEPIKNAELIQKNKDRLPVRTRPMLFFIPIFKDEGVLDQVINSNAFGERACVAIIGDGSVDARTGALFEPYTDDPTALGMLYYSDDELYRFVEKAHLAGLQVSIHAESDRSIEQAISTYEKVLEKHPRKDHRHRIEHFEMPIWDHIKRVARAGVVLAMQPMFIPVGGGPNLEYYRALFGEERIKRYQPLRSILNECILVSGGSDSPITRMNPLGGIQVCLTHPIKEQRIELYEALKIFTINGAKIGFEEKLKGSIEEGKLADFVVLSEDPNRVPHDKIGNIGVEMTIVGGKVVYKREADTAHSH